MDTTLLEEVLEQRACRAAYRGLTRPQALDRALADFMDDAGSRLQGSELYYFRAIMIGARSSLDPGEDAKSATPLAILAARG